jgi:hypothetical protein
MKNFILLTAILAAALFARNIDLYYTDDGRTVKAIHGFFINDNFTLSQDGDESWLIVAGQKIGPNGYVPKESKIQLGTFGKSHALFQLMNEDFLGFGHSKHFEKTVSVSAISYILPDPTAFEPLHVSLMDGTDGELFVAGDYTESTGSKVVRENLVNEISIIQLKYDIPRSQRGVDTRPQQLGIKAKAVAFTESGLRKAMGILADMQDKQLQEQQQQQ